METLAVYAIRNIDARDLEDILAAMRVAMDRKASDKKTWLSSHRWAGSGKERREAEGFLFNHREWMDKYRTVISSIPREEA